MHDTSSDSITADILVMDDNLENLQLLNKLLARHNYNVRPAINAEDALEAVKRRKPDLALLDIRMPGMGGFEVCNQLKSETETQDIPIIFISGLEEAQNKVQAFKTGGVDYITKPFEESEVLARVHTHLSLAHARNSLKALAEELEERVQKRTAELAASKEQLAMVLEGSQQGFWDWNIETGEVQRNEYWAKMLGYTSIKELEANTDTWTDSIYPEDRDAAWAAINDHLEGRSPDYKLEYRMLTKDGKIKWILDQARIVKRDAAGAPLRMCGTHTDITELKQAQQEKELLQNQLQQAQKMESLGILTGGIAHDFNNLLGIINGYTDLILNQINDMRGEKLTKYLERIRNAGDRAAKLVAQMLVFSRYEQVDNAPLNLSPLLKEDIKMLRSALPSTIEITSTIDSNLPSVLMNPTQLNQIIMNLSINARDAMNGTGKLAIKLQWAHALDTRSTISHKPIKGDWIELSVSDNGSGIDPEIAKNIFDPFFTTKEVGMGTGMGLSMIYRIMENHNGHIILESEPGKGSTFRLLFAPSPEENCSNHYLADLHSEVPKGDNSEILVVDDEPMLSEQVAELLTLQGYKAHSMTDSIAALELFEKDPNRFSILITDQTMPKMTGVELIAKFREIKPELPVIMCSGYSDKIDAEKAAKINISYMQKPVNTESLMLEIATLLDINNTQAINNSQTH